MQNGRAEEKNKKFVVSEASLFERQVEEETVCKGQTELLCEWDNIQDLSAILRGRFK